MEKMPAGFVGHGDPMIALKINEMTETLKKVGKDIIENNLTYIETANKYRVSTI